MKYVNPEVRREYQRHLKALERAFSALWVFHRAQLREHPDVAHDEVRDLLLEDLAAVLLWGPVTIRRSNDRLFIEAVERLLEQFRHTVRRMAWGYVQAGAIAREGSPQDPVAHPVKSGGLNS